MKQVKSIVLGLALNFGVASLGNAVTQVVPQDQTNNHYALIENADFIVSGEVKKIQFESFSNQHSQGVPTTLVTYKVDRVFHGDIKAANFIRLRFAGGVSDNGAMLQIPIFPKFEKGDYDLLFVSGNGNSPCPLVGCIKGRIRVHDGFMINEGLSLDRVALRFDGSTLYPAVEPLVAGDIHASDDYVLKTQSEVVLDARTVPFDPKVKK
jgi:hypothetical protein